MFGNGLKAQIWKPFAEKFGIKEIYEFYGATESNSNLGKYHTLYIKNRFMRVNVCTLSSSIRRRL